MIAFREFLCSIDESKRADTVSYLAMVYLAHQCIAVYLLQEFMDDVVKAFTANRIINEDSLAKAEMKYMMDGSIPDGGEWKMFSSCTCDLEPSIPLRY